MLLGLVLALGLAAMDATIVATAIPSIVHDLGGFSMIAWVFSLYVLAQGVSTPIYGKLTDIFGRKPILLTGIVIFLAGSVLSGASWNMVALIVFRGIQGIGAGAIQPVVMTVAGDLYTVEERARIQGWLSSVWGISAVIGPAIGGFFAQYASWRWIFYINLPIGAIALFMIVTNLRENVTRRQHRIDYAGSALLAVGVALLIFGVLEGGVQWPWLSLPSVLVFAASAVVLFAFTQQERRAAEPTLPGWVFRNRVLLGVSLSGAVVGVLTIGLTTFLPTFAQGVLGVGAVVAGFTLAAMSISWPLASTFSGRLYLRIGFRNTAVIGTVFTVVAGLIFVVLPQSAPIWTAALASLVMGAGLGLISTPLLVGAQSIVDWKRRGVVTGAYMFAQLVGEAVGAAIFGSVANATLAAWLAQAPASLAGHLPASLNGASQLLGSGAGAQHSPAGRYVQQGLYGAVHQVFVGLLIIALAGLVIVLLTPRKFSALPDVDASEVLREVSADDQQGVSSAAARTP